VGWGGKKTVKPAIQREKEKEKNPFSKKGGCFLGNQKLKERGEGPSFYELSWALQVVKPFTKKKPPSWPIEKAAPRRFVCYEKVGGFPIKNGNPDCCQGGKNVKKRGKGFPPEEKTENLCQSTWKRSAPQKPSSPSKKKINHQSPKGATFWGEKKFPTPKNKWRENKMKIIILGRRVWGEGSSFFIKNGPATFWMLKNWRRGGGTFSPSS